MLSHFRPLVLLALLTTTACQSSDEPLVQDAHLTPVATLNINPGNAAITPDGRIFATIHQFRRAPLQLVQITGPDSYQPWPDANWNDRTRPAGERFVSLLGIRADTRGWVWVIDNGNDEGATYPPKLLAFDSRSGQLAFRHDFPNEVAAPGAFPQDFAVDTQRGFVYIADIGGNAKPAILTVDLKSNTSWRLEGLKEFEAEDVDNVIDGKVVTMRKKGKERPARIGIDPITLSADGETIFFGAMNGKTWYALPADVLRRNMSSEEAANRIRRVGNKPISDGAITDARGNHYFTDLGGHGITLLPAGGGDLTPLVRDPRLSWPDGVAFGPDGALYVTVNQLHLSPPLNKGVDGGRPPFHIFRFQP
jgi:sugar lactone lactonase YvrE